MFFLLQYILQEVILFVIFERLYLDIYFRLFCTFYYGLASHPGKVEIFVVASCYRNWDMCQPSAPLGSYADFTYVHNIMYASNSSILNRTVSHYFLSQQRRRTPLWTKIMKINSFFGTEDFYIPMGIFILW